MDPLDFGSREAVRAWLDDLREQIDDAIGAAEDATRSPGRRDLGRRMARRIVLGARESIASLLDSAERGAGGTT
jgi:hypothetical protein